MKNYSVSDFEEQRLSALKDSAILDTEPEEDFDALVELACKICHVPVSLVSFIDADRQWFKARYGFGPQETHRSWSFCAHAIRQNGIFEVEDALLDDRFCENPLVTGDPWIRFYAGYPLFSDNGMPLGTFCIIDVVPRSLTADERSKLKLFALQAQTLLRLRNAIQSLHKKEGLLLIEEARRKKNELLYNEAERIGNVGHCEFDFVQNTWKGSRQLYSIFGIPETTGNSISDWWDEVDIFDREAVHQYFSSIIQSRSRFEREVKIRNKKTGEVRWVTGLGELEFDGSGVLCRLVGTVQDITQKKKTEKNLTENQRFLSNLINNLPGFVFRKSVKKEMEFEYISDGVLEVTGYSATEFLGSSAVKMSDLLFPEDADLLGRKLEEAISGRKNYEVTFRIKAGNGETVWLWERGVPVFNSRGICVALEGIVSNVSDARKVESDLKDSLILVTEQNKRLLNFSYIVSHNLRSHTSNIRAILGYLDETEEEEEKQEMMGHLKEISRSLDDSILNLNQIVSIQRNVNIVVKPLVLTTFVENARIILSKSIFEKKAQVVNDIPDSYIIPFNPAYLESIILNFLSNSLKYNRPGVPLVIRFSAAKRDGYTELVVSDNGRGIDLDKYGEKIFGMYTSFGPNKDGKGLGLFIIKNQIEAMRGYVTVDSKPGQGAQFRVFFNETI